MSDLPKRGPIVVELIFLGDPGAPDERELRDWLVAAYAGDFTAEDWAHMLDGQHALIRDERGIVSHAAIVPRIIVCDGRPLRAAYVEAVATRADQRRLGNANRVMRQLGEIIAADYDIGVLSTGVHPVYLRLGWERWRGASYVQRFGKRLRTAEEDEGLMVLRTSRTTHIDLSGDIVADWRAGDVW